jgi:hypothetical protein
MNSNLVTLPLKLIYMPRYYPVANLTRTRQGVILEPLRPEKFLIRRIDSTPLYGLSICEVRKLLPVPEFIDQVLGVKMIVFAKTSPNRSFSI